MQRIATSGIDLFDDEVLVDPYPFYGVLRELGSVVYLEKHDLFAIPRYSEARAVLRDWRQFTSTQGIGFNEVRNQHTGGLLRSDPPEHDLLRSAVMRWMSPKWMRTIQESIDAKATELVSALVEKGSFDAVTDLAESLPVRVVGDLVGFPIEVRRNWLAWSDASFNCEGPMNDRTRESLEVLELRKDFLFPEDMSPANLEPGSIGRDLLEAVLRGELERPNAMQVLSVLTFPSIDTTASGIATAIHQLGLHPEQWQLVKGNPSLIPAVCNEVLRFEAPLQVFSRVATKPTDLADCSIPQGGRVAVLFGSANRDPLKFEDPDRFDVTREAGDHLSFGFGIHHCLGAQLARMEMRAALAAMTSQVDQIVVGEPSRRLGNVTRRLAHLPVSV